MYFKLLKFSISFFLLLSVVNIKAQTIEINKKFDSISTLVEKTKQTDSIVSLLNLQKELAEKANDKKRWFTTVTKLATYADRGSSKQLEYLQTAVALSEELEDTDALITSSIKLARVHQVRNDYKNAFYYVNKAIELLDKTKNKNLIIEGYATRANIYNNLSQNTAAIKDLNVAKKIALQLPDNEKELIPLLKTASFIHYSNDQYEEGLKILDEIIAFYAEKGDEQKNSIWRNNKAMVHLSCECVSVETQKENLYKSIKSAKKINFKAGEAYAYVHLSRVLKNEKKLDSAYIYLEQASKIDLGRKAARFNGYLNQIKGDFWATKDNATQAIKYFEEAYTIWDNLNVLKDKQYTAKALSQFYKKKNNAAEAYKYMEIYAAIKDSTFNKQKVEERKEIELNYQFEKQKYKDSIQNAEAIEIMALEQQNKIQKEQHIQQILLGLFIAALLLGMFAYYAYQRKKKISKLLDEKNKIVEKALQEKQLLIKEIHHRVKNNFQIISSLLELQTKGIEDKKALELVQEGKNRVRSMALIHQKLYQNDDLLIDINDYVNSLVKNISSSFGKDKNPKIHFNIPDFKFDIDTVIPLGLIINELITNAYKYGLNQNAQILAIQMEQIENKAYKLTIKDSGKGLPLNFDFRTAKSLGLRLVRRLSQQLHGNLNYTYNNGAIFSVIFKDSFERSISN